MSARVLKRTSQAVYPTSSTVSAPAAREPLARDWNAHGECLPVESPESSPVAMPVLDHVALREPDDARSRVDGWLDSTDKGRASGKASTVEAEWARPGWDQELDPRSEGVQSSIKASRGGLSGRIERLDTSPASGDGVTNDAALTGGIDSKGMRAGGELAQSSGPHTWRAGGTIGTDGVQLYGKGESRLGSDKLSESGSMSFGPDGLAMKAGLAARTDQVAVSPLADPTRDLSSHRAPGAASQARVSAAASGVAKGDITAKKPRKVPGGYAVDWSAKGSVGGASAASVAWEGLELGGDKSIGGIPGARGSGQVADLGASASGGLDGRLEGTALFPTEEEAMAFYNAPIPSAPALTADGALGMAEGERSRLQVGVRGSVGVSAGGTGTSTAGLGTQASGSLGVQVERIDDDVFAVTRDLSGDISAHAGLGAPGLDVAGQGTVGGMRAATWQLDLSTESGRAGYEALLSGHTPEPGPGVTLPDEVSASFDALSTNVSGPGGSVQVGVRSTDQELGRPDGTRRLSEEGVETQRVSPWKFLRDLLPASDSDTGLDASTELDANGGESGSEVRIVGRSESNAARYNYEGIGRAGALSDAYNPRDGEGTPGRWSVQTTFGEGSLDRLAAKVEHERFDDPSYLRLLTTPERRFVEQMRAASGDRDKQRAAVQELGEHGVEAATIVRKLLGSGETYVSLEGSETWIGEEGHGEVEERIAKARAQLEANDPSSAVALRRDLDLQKVRLHDLTDYGKYQDVPSTLREKEIERTRLVILRIAALLERAGVSTGAEGEQGLQKPIATQRRKMDDAYRDVLLRWERHGVDLPGTGAPWHDLGQRGLLGGALETDRYDLASSHRLAGEGCRRRGGQSERAAMRADEVGRTDTADELRGRVLAEFVMAYTRFVQAGDVLAAIERDNEGHFS